jgi:hypothetical protein
LRQQRNRKTIIRMTMVLRKTAHCNRSESPNTANHATTDPAAVVGFEKSSLSVSSVTS